MRKVSIEAWCVFERPAPIAVALPVIHAQRAARSGAEAQDTETAINAESATR